MRCLQLIIAYDGTSYCGWQRQRNVPTVQGTIEEFLGIMTREKVTLHGAGRTDAGVHALAMSASFSTHSSIDCPGFCKGLNSLLPKDIRIVTVREVAENFHARFNCLGKEYCYNFSVNPILLPTQRLYLAHYPGAFDLSVALECLAYLVGEHDFSSFEAVGSRDLSFSGGRGAVRKIRSALCEQSPHDDGCFSLTIAGDGFLRHMVRNIAGTVIETAQAKRTVGDFVRLFEAKDRSQAGSTAPACGLVLKQVFY